MSRWWRAYDEALHDPKLLALSDKMHRVWFQLLCVASKHGGTLPAMSIIALELRLSTHKAAEYITALVMAGLIDKMETGAFAPHNWPKRQFQSDVSTDRVKRFRKHKRNVSSAVSETPPETEAETDTSLRSVARKRAERLPSDWVPSPEDLEFAQSKALSLPDAKIEADKFRNYWTAKSGKDAAKLDWPATWRNWILNAIERRGQQRTAGFAPRPGSKEDMRERTHDAYQKLSEYVASHADDEGGSGGAGEENVRLLPLAKPA